MTPCTTCDGQTLKALAEAGKNWLEVNYQKVNQLNVFPVPDGDTGTNMLLTIRTAYHEIAANPSPSAAQIAKGLAYGAVMGSRGNSGTIMSQIWAGFAQGLGEATVFDIPLATEALKMAAQKAYAGVQKPVEGTILTVIREMAEEAESIRDTVPDLLGWLEKIIQRGWVAVQRTPDLLPILKEAGVVDSGGTGLMYILEGMLKHLRGEKIEVQPAEVVFEPEEADLLALGDTLYNYDVQFVLRGQGLHLEQIRADIEAMGDSGVIVGTDSLIKVHIHVDDPGIPISYGVKLGILEDVVVENMQAQYEALLARQQVKLRQINPGEVGVVAVASGKGLAQLFGDLGAAAIVDGGQSNNPSTEEILTAVRSTQTDKVIVLPNNKNIQLAAQQAAQHSLDIEMVVLPTKTMPQGIAAMIAYDAEGDLQTVAHAMGASIQDVVTIEITTAVRTVEIDGVAVQAGQLIALIDNVLQVAGQDVLTVIQAVFEKIELDEYELVTLYYGEGVSAQQAKTLAQTLAEQYDDLEFEVVYGGQPHYPYIMGVE